MFRKTRCSSLLIPNKYQSGRGYESYDRLLEAAQSRAAVVAARMQKKMKYCDLHCDALTVEGAPCVTKENLQKGDCLMQCFAAFVSAREGRFSACNRLIDGFYDLCAKQGYRPVTRAGELDWGAVNALLTVEEGGAVEGEIEKLEFLFRRGVRMMTLTWNYENEIGYPAFFDYENVAIGRASQQVRNAAGGLKKFGFEAVERMFSLGMIPDVSHGSDLLVTDVAAVARAANKPFVASHSGAASAFYHARNLTDEGIKAIADSGGVVGLDFCADFLSNDVSEEGQRAAMLAHAKAIVNAGGEEVLAIGSDFDGIPQNAYQKSPADVARLFIEFTKFFGFSAAEKFARKNFLRVLCAYDCWTKEK